ncbi:hypothetical protein BYT27DRAFT_7261939 [Phlegmacium glaucopus]|nr:hypothetical protein BYT27DRAFT_7261939 [Phlegmacium glaucopus]
MPSESSFKKQAQFACDALTNFNTVLPLKAPTLIKPALLELAESTAAFSTFAPFFLTHPLFQELLPAVHNTIEDFKSKNPDFPLPENTHKIANLDADVKDALKQNISKQTSSMPVGKHPHLSQDFDNSDGDDIACFLDNSAILSPKSSVSKPSGKEHEPAIIFDSGSNVPMDVDPQHSSNANGC